jgi:dTDP-4-dehydrorhamnose 3,5-epimerase-like enzyme
MEIKKIKLKQFVDLQRGGTLIPFELKDLVDWKAARFYWIVANPKVDKERGGHFHKETREIVIPLAGKTTMIFKDLKTDDLEIVILDADDPEAVYIEPGIFHTVASMEFKAVLGVLTSNNYDDERKDYYKQEAH